MDTSELTPKESFAIINKAISNFKSNYQESAKIFLLWGWVLTLACFSQFATIKILQNTGQYELIGPISIGNWVLFFAVGLIIQFFVIRRINHEKKVGSYLEDYLKSLWLVCVTSIIVAIIISFLLDISFPPIIMLIVGIGTTTTGLLIRFRPLVIGGVSFFAFSIASAFVSNEYVNLLIGAAIVIGHLIPAYLLRSAKN
ncbi:MAG: hypothetical protein AAF944_18040 [Bacteroidota bacterium]